MLASQWSSSIDTAERQRQCRKPRWYNLEDQKHRLIETMTPPRHSSGLSVDYSHPVGYQSCLRFLRVNDAVTPHFGVHEVVYCLL